MKHYGRSEGFYAGICAYQAHKNL